MKKNFRMMIVSALRCWGIIGTVMVIVSLLSCKQGHIPNTDMPELRNDTGVNISPSTPPVPPPPPAAPENLVKNADFSTLTDDTSQFKDYWTDKKRPASWNTWVVGNQGTHDGITFKTADKSFTIATGATTLKNGGIQQPITLPDTTDGTKYRLKAKIKAVSQSGAGGAALVKLQNKWLISFTGADKDFECLITVKAGNKIAFHDRLYP